MLYKNNRVKGFWSTDSILTVEIDLHLKLLRFPFGGGGSSENIAVSGPITTHLSASPFCFILLTMFIPPFRYLIYLSIRYHLIE